jgi:hypothetical protein
MDYINKFRELFKLSGKSQEYASGKWLERKDYRISIEISKYGAIRLSLWEMYEPCEGELTWYEGKLIWVDGSPKELAPLLWIAERLGLPAPPDLATIRETPEYKRIAETGITLE